MKHNFNLDTIRKFISDNEYHGIPDNAEDLYTTANAVTNLLLEPLDINIYNRKWPWDEFWLDKQAQMYPKLKIMLSGPLKNFALFFLYQVNRNWLSSRNFLIYILTHKEPAPDLTYLLTNIVIAAYDVNPELLQDQRSLACQQLFADKLKILLSTDQEWQRVMNLENISITNMGGFRNTLLNVYKEDLEDIEPWQDSDSYWDIGGGHHTPWISQRWNKPFTSLDMQAPSKYEDVTFRQIVDVDQSENRPVGKLQNLSGLELAAYKHKLNKQPWQYYDVFEHQLPPRARTTVVSTGFISSTMTDLNWKTHWSHWFPDTNKVSAPPGPRMKALSLMAILGCVQLAHQGLDLELITVSRPSVYATARRVVQLRWQQGKLIMNHSKPHNIDQNKHIGIVQMTYDVKEKRRSIMLPSTTFWENIQC
jgi:hypothetical protein